MNNLQIIKFRTSRNIVEADGTMKLAILPQDKCYDMEVKFRKTRDMVPPILEKRERWCRVYENSSTVMFDINTHLPSCNILSTLEDGVNLLCMWETVWAAPFCRSTSLLTTAPLLPVSVG